MAYKLMHYVEGSFQSPDLYSGPFCPPGEVTCGCPTGVGWGLLASSGEGQGHRWTSHRAQDYQEAPAPHRLPRGGCLPQSSRSCGRRLPSVQLGSRKEWALGRGKLGEELLAHCPKAGKLLAPPRQTQIKHLPIPVRLLCRASSFLNGAARGSKPLKNGELITHEFKNIYKVLFLGSSLSFSTVQSRVVWGKVGKRTIENVLWEAPNRTPSWELSPQRVALVIWGRESGTLLSQGDSHSRLPRKYTCQHNDFPCPLPTLVKIPATETSD